MKRILSLILCFCMLFSLVACSSGLANSETKTIEESQEQTTEPKKETVDNSPIVYPQSFSVGFGREVVNPAVGTGLGGYGNANDRLSKEVLDDLKLTCTALCDGENVILLYSTDLPYIGADIVTKAANILEKAYGIPAKNVIFNATHTHSGPAMINSSSTGIPKYCKLYYEAVQKTAETALRDLEEATILIGKGDTTGLNYVRRYVSLVDGSYLGKNLDAGQDPKKVGHETEADHEMQIVKFDRKTKKDVVLCNWQCHPTGPGGSTSYVTSADYIGALRDKVEADADVLFSFHQGAGGNLAQGSPIQGENNYGGDRHVEHGQELAKVALATMNNLAPIASGKIQSSKTILEVEFKPEIISGKQKRLFSNQLNLLTITVGDLAFATCPGEPHDTVGKEIKKNSPFQMTFFCGYTNHYVSYIPADFAYANGGYEVEASDYAKGTAEKIASTLLTQLNTLYPTR